MSFLSDRGRGTTKRAKTCSRSYICSLCPKSCVTSVSLAEHYVSTRHGRKVQSSEPQEQNGGICLSFFLKTHMKEDTIVGLEYVMEMKKDSSYTYSCRLCKKVNANLPTIVQHIINLLHTERYIEKHFKYLLPPYRDRDRTGPKRSRYTSVLRNAAVMIAEQQGSKEIRVVLLESDGTTSEDPPPSKPESDCKTQGASEDPPPSKPESDCKTQGASEDPSPSKSESDCKTSEDPPPFKPESDGKTSEDPPPSKLKSDCKTQGASEDPSPSKPESDGTTSEDPSPSKPESDCKTQGASEDPSPSKSESDCKTSEDPPPSKPESDGKMKQATKALLKVAQTICTKFGQGKICVKNSNAGNPDVVAVPSPIEDIKNNCALPSTGNDLQTEHTKERLPYSCIPCNVTCSSALDLCQHITGSKHKNNLHLTQERDDANRLSSFLNVHMKDPVVGLEYVMEVKQGSMYKFSCQLCGVVDVDLMKIVSHITDSNHIECYALKHYSHMFFPLVPHIHRTAHVKAMRKIAATIIRLQGGKNSQLKSTSVDGLTESALFPGGDGNARKAAEDTLPSKPKGDRKKKRKAFKDTLPSKHESRSSHSKWRPLSNRDKGLDESHESYSKRPKVSKNDDLPLAKRSRLSPEGDWDSLPSRSHISKHRSSHYESHAIRMDCTTAVQELEFRTNEEFFNYVSNFVISNDEDAVFIQNISQNCIRAMTNFQVEEAESQKTNYHSETPLAHTSRTAQEIPGILEKKTESHSWGSEMTLLKDTSNPPSESMPKNKVTDDFFSSIKNMSESEVIGIFQKIATANPEFQGMDIPTVIRFLKNSGRLKKP